jgi:hypothetical protein
VSEKITLTVEEVAIKQLESAIWMYAYDFDETAVHTIAAAAYELLTKRLNFGDFEDQFAKQIPDSKKGEFWSKFNEPYNFFKHGANRHKNMDTLTYSSDSVELVLMAACYANTYMEKSKQLACAHAFMSYQMVRWPNFFEDSEYKKMVDELRRKALEGDINIHDKKLLVLSLGQIKKPFIV